MEDVIGLILFGVYIVCVISVAAGVTWLVVRLTPTKTPKPQPSADT